MDPTTSSKHIIAPRTFSTLHGAGHRDWDDLGPYKLSEPMIKKLTLSASGTVTAGTKVEVVVVKRSEVELLPNPSNKQRNQLAALKANGAGNVDVLCFVNPVTS